jgi:hypothetical protein
MRFLSEKNKKYFLLLITIFIFPMGEKANPEAGKNNKNIIKIDGEAEPASVSDIPLPEFDYDFDSFDSGFHPGKELISLLDRPADLTGMGEKEFAQEFPIEK